MTDHPSVDEPVETRLLVALFAVLRRLKERVPGVAIDPAAFFVLHAVHSRGPVRPSDLAEGLRLDASTISRHVRQLETAGHLVRLADPQDRRACQVSVSEAGRTVLDTAFQARRSRVAAAMAGWSAADRELLAALMVRLSEDLDEVDTSTAVAVEGPASGTT
ncbi:MAG: MarR family transcriptional regulator [Actinobacteria bacterium]|nr:MarR family transcriptional regulator [Actinomycetota bacterium]MBI3686681.1 MarR family transcriptional regulator [Actinomycetota bacterium]